MRSGKSRLSEQAPCKHNRTFATDELNVIQVLVVIFVAGFAKLTIC